jgi:hypothetical protein
MIRADNLNGGNGIYEKRSQAQSIPSVPAVLALRQALRLRVCDGWQQARSRAGGRSHASRTARLRVFLPRSMRTLGRTPDHVGSTLAPPRPNRVTPGVNIR